MVLCLEVVHECMLVADFYEDNDQPEACGCCLHGVWCIQNCVSLVTKICAGWCTLGVFLFSLWLSLQTSSCRLLCVRGLGSLCDHVGG